MAESDDILDDLFHGCAFAAFVDQAREQGHWPAAEATRRHAYDEYEKALRDKGMSRTARQGDSIPSANAGSGSR